MNKKQIKKEWERLNYELLKSKPEIEGPYPSNIVRKRELLLFAQVHLSNIIDARQEETGGMKILKVKCITKL